MLILTKQQYEDIAVHSLRAIPNEACGLIGGIIENDQKTVKRVYLLTNIDNSPEHFSMDPKEQFAAIKDMRSNGWVMLGNFHSHPESPSRPSDEDKRLAYDTAASYLILSLMNRERLILKSFRIENDGVSEEGIKIV
jgi:[CysO sulfur-carrier protein]-S-L-cysteine hydrolase